MISDLEVRQCRILLAVADLGGIGRAASHLGTAQSTISEAVFSLERLTGKPMLVRRRGAGVSLTAAAETLLPYARSLVAAAEAAVAAVESHGATSIRVGAIESVSSFLLPSAVHAMQTAKFECKIQVTTGVCDDLRAQLLSDDLDMAITLQPARGVNVHSGLHRRSLGTAPLSLVVAPDFCPLDRLVTPQELAKSQLILPDPRGALNELVEQWQRDQGIAPRTTSAGSIDGVKRSAALGVGIGILVGFSVQDELEGGLLARVKTLTAVPGLELEALTRPENESSSLDFLATELARQLRSRS